MSEGTVLVVDDSIDARRAVRVILTKAGYQVIEAEDGEEAIKILKAEERAPTVDVILCDLLMPKMNGAEVIAHLKAHYPSVPFVIMTGERDFLLTEVLAKQGVCDYLIKPVSNQKLLEVMRVAVRLHELRKKQLAT